jgi:hypothetical protein
MRGYPPLHLLLLMLFFGGLLIPLIHLTSPKDKLRVTAQTNHDDVETLHCGVSLKVLPRAETIKIRQGDKVIIDEDLTMLDGIEFEIEVALNKAIADLEIEVQWKDGVEGQRVVGFEISPDEMESKMYTFWCERSILKEQISIVKKKEAAQ